MATGFEFFERDLRVATAGMEPDAINHAVAAFAKQELRRVIANGSASPRYERYVNGIQGAAEEAYRAPGAIVYEFTNWPVVINAAIEELQRRVPRKSGLYAGSFIVIAGGRVVTEYSSIGADAEVIIVNSQPYTRRMDNSRTHGRRHFLLAYHALRRRFGDVFRITNVYLKIGAGVHPQIPYILKGGARLRAAVQNNRSSAFREGRATLAPRRETEAGRPITYPALVINPAR
jgi:hypothetical protein